MENTEEIIRRRRSGEHRRSAVVSENMHERIIRDSPRSPKSPVKVFDPVGTIEDQMQLLPAWLDLLHVSAVIGFIAVILDLEVLEHVVLLGVFAYLYYVRNFKYRLTRQGSRRQDSSPDCLLADGKGMEFDPGTTFGDPSGGFFTMPIWQVFPDWDRTRWLNSVIHAIWPIISPPIEKLVFDNLDPILDKFLTEAKIKTTKVINNIKTVHIKLGPTPVVVEAMKAYPVQKNFLTLDVKFRWVSESDFLVKVATPFFPELFACVENLQVSGIIRLRASLVPHTPVVTSLGAQLTTAPVIDFNIHLTMSGSKGGINAMNLPLVESILEEIIKLQLFPLIVFPNWVPIPLPYDVPGAADQWKSIRVEKTQGVLAVKLISASNLVNMDFPFGISDPYAVMRVGESKAQTSTCKGSTLNPVWNEVFVFEVHNRDIQPLSIKLFDSDMGGRDDDLGAIVVKFDLLANNEIQTIAAPLQNVHRGTIQLQLLWMEAEEGSAQEVRDLKYQAEFLMHRGQVVRPQPLGARIAMTDGSAVQRNRLSSGEAPLVSGSGVGLERRVSAAVDFSSSVWLEKGGCRTVWTQRRLTISHGHLHIYLTDRSKDPKLSFPLAGLTVAKLGSRRAAGTLLHLLDVVCRDVGAHFYTAPFPTHAHHEQMKFGFDDEDKLHDVVQKIVAGGGTSLIGGTSSNINGVAAFELQPGTHTQPLISGGSPRS